MVRLEPYFIGPSMITNIRHVSRHSPIFAPLTEIICAFTEQIQKFTAGEKKQLKGGLDLTLRIFTGTHASFVSKRLADYIKTNNIALNPFDLVWEQRYLLGRIKAEKRVLPYAVWEHTIPIKMFRESLISTRDKWELIKKIEDYPGVAWISREENNELNKKYRSSRPGGFLKCYELVGINLLSEQEYKKLYIK